MELYKKETTELIKKLVRLKSVNGINSEKAVVNLIANQCKLLDLPFKIFAKNSNHPNIFVGENFSKPTGLLLIAHTDTADIGELNKWNHGPFSGTTEGNRLFGRGAIDNKSGIALSLYSLKILKDRGKLNLAKFIGVSDEEKGADSQFGARFLLDLGLSAKAAIYTYPGTDTITIGHRGQVKLWVTVSGESAHTGSRGWQDGTKGASAMDSLVDFLVALKNINLSGTHAAFPHYAFKQTVLLVNGGSITSLVPDSAKALIDARLLPIHSNIKYIEKVKVLAKKFETEKIKFNIQVQTNLPAAFIEEDEKIVTTLKKLSKEILNTTPEIRGCGPANEGYMFINSNIPTICGFGVEGEGAHSANEYVELESIPKILQIYTKTAEEL